MIAFPEFRSVETIYAVANTPTFLAKKLREDEDVINFGKRSRSEDLMDELGRLTSEVPTSFREKYLPLVILSAIASKGDRKYLRQAAAFDRGTVRWYHEVLEYLIQTTGSDSVRIFDILGDGDLRVATRSANSSTNSVKSWD